MKSNGLRIVKNSIATILVVLIFFFSFISLINYSFNSMYIQTHVKGFSMQPTINLNATNPEVDGDKIYINKYSKISLNDIVVAKTSWHNDYIIKRVVATPGDKMYIEDEVNHFAIYVNDQLLYTKEKYGEDFEKFKTGSYANYNNYLKFLENEEFAQYIKKENELTYIQLGENEYFLMGDNWGHTTDSLEKGPVKTNEIIGKVDLIIDVANTNPFTSTLFFLKNLFS